MFSNDQLLLLVLIIVVGLLVMLKSATINISGKFQDMPRCYKGKLSGVIKCFGFAQRVCRWAPVIVVAVIFISHFWGMLFVLVETVGSFFSKLIFSLLWEGFNQLFSGFGHIPVFSSQKPPTGTDLLVQASTAFILSAVVVGAYALYDLCFGGDESAADAAEESSETEPRTRIPRNGEPTYIARKVVR